ncbi:MAG: hypothetical protein H7Y01_15935 [Ferruginibacter sp.]|nr:hypothetical protein [Chitinophagaceae bacterium]
MRKLAIFLLTVLLISCKKDESEDFSHGDVWVEKTLRLDTIEFNSLLASSFNSMYFRSLQYMNGYNYQVKTDSILLRSFASSSLVFNPYYFNHNSSNQFTISNFFQRASLPAIVQFEKIK